MVVSCTFSLVSRTVTDDLVARTNFDLHAGSAKRTALRRVAMRSIVCALLLCISASASALKLQPVVSRRGVLALSSATALLPDWAVAAEDKSSDLSRLKKGLESVQYLLDNWDTETIDPTTGDDSPDRVRYFLGLRTTDHPLFQVDKLLTKAQKTLPDDVDFEVWIDSVEGLNSHIAKVNELAYTSSFGEVCAR